MGASSRVIAIGFSVFALSVASFIVDESTTWVADNRIYWSPSSTISHLASCKNCPAHSKTPCTVLSTNTSSINANEINKLLSEFEQDDVWSRSFASCLYLQHNGQDPAPPIVQAALPELLGPDTKYLYIGVSSNTPESMSNLSAIPVVVAQTKIPDGPYLVSASQSGLQFANVYAAGRDFSASFQSPVIPRQNSNDTFSVQHIVVKDYLETFVPVPSRLHSRGDSRRLAGLRFGIKDIFPVSGVRMTGGSRAYYSVHNASIVNCTPVQRLLDLGAVFLGTTKTFAFSSVDIATDYLMPWNPRGDNALNTGGSSIGSGSAVTSYDWIDFAVGADTGGSVRGPANAGGIYGYRPTQGIMDLTGVIPAIKEQDTTGHLTRSPYLFSTIGKEWYAGLGNLHSYNTLPGKLLVGTDLTALPYPEQQILYEAFLRQLESFMGLNRTNINITSTWLATSNISEPLSTWAAPIYHDLNDVQNWRDVGKPLATAYGAEHDGAFPPVEIGLIDEWTQGMPNTTTGTYSRYNQSAEKRQIFKKWLERIVLSNDTSSCTSSLLVYSNTAAPYYRTLIHEPFTTFVYIPFYIAAYAGNPEITIPIAQAPYFSSRSNKTELYPLTVQIQAAATCDYVLFDLVEKLADSGILNTTLTGKVAYWAEGVEETLYKSTLGRRESLPAGFPF